MSHLFSHGAPAAGQIIVKELTKQDSSSPVPPAQRNPSPRSDSNPADPALTKSAQIFGSMIGRSAFRKIPSVESSKIFWHYIKFS
jgi:hypothetical protein